MRSLLEKTFFTVGESPYSWADVVLYAVLRGEWEQVTERGRAVWAALAREEAGDESLVQDEEVEAETDRFRYSKDLVSVEDTEKWLGGWALDIDTWLTWVRGDILRRRFEAEGETTAALAAAFEGDEEDLEAFVWAEGVLSGVLGRLARELAGRAAACLKLEESGDLRVEDGPVELPVEDVEGLLPGFPADDTLRRLQALARLEKGFLGFREAVITPEAVAARVRARQGDWMKVTCRILRLPTEDVAREALLSIQEDGDEMEDVAAGAGGELEEGTFYLEELEPALSSNLLAAKAGELLGPLRTKEGFAVVTLLEKRIAAQDDPEVRERAEESLFDGMVDRECDNRVIWRWGR